MAITFANLGASANPDINNATDATSYVNTSWTPPTTGVIWTFILSANASGLTAVNGMSGNGLTWEQIATVEFALTTRRLSLWAALAAGSSAGATTVDFGANTQLACIAAFGHADSVDESGTLQSIFVQKPTNTATTGTSGSVTLAAAGHADNRPIAGFAHIINEAKTERTNWTEADDLSGTAPVRNLETQFRSDAFETTASASWTTDDDWAGIAAELKAAAEGAGPAVAEMNSLGAISYYYD